MDAKTEKLNDAKDRIVKLRVDKNLLMIEIRRLTNLLRNERKVGKWLYKENKRLEEIIERYKEAK